MPGESSSKESTQSSIWKDLLVVTFGMGVASMISLIVAILMIMYCSYGNEMWNILFQLKTGIIP